MMIDDYLEYDLGPPNDYALWNGQHPLNDDDEMWQHTMMKVNISRAEYYIDYIQGAAQNRRNRGSPEGMKDPEKK